MPRDLKLPPPDDLIHFERDAVEVRALLWRMIQLLDGPLSNESGAVLAPAWALACGVSDLVDTMMGALRAALRGSGSRMEGE